MDPNQGMLPPVQGPAPGAAPVSPPAPGSPPPPGMAPGAAPPPGGTPSQVTRDYTANPINQEDMDNVNKFTIMATKVIHTPQTREKILGRIKGVQHPYDEIADAALVVMSRVEQEGAKDQPWDQAVKVMGGAAVVDQVIEMASAAGKIPEEIPENDQKVILGQAIQKYYQQKIATGEITKAQAAEDAHMASQVQAQMGGADVQGINKRVEATQAVKGQGVAPPEAMNPQMGALKAPQPAADPMRPETTMKEVLGGGGGLLDA